MGWKVGKTGWHALAGCECIAVLIPGQKNLALISQVLPGFCNDDYLFMLHLIVLNNSVECC
jgi:hypothetical protein